MLRNPLNRAIRLYNRAGIHLYEDAKMLKRLLLLLSLIAFVAIGVSSAQDEMPTFADLDDGWNIIETDGVCAPGTDYEFYVLPGSMDDLHLYFFGGGACWNAETCNFRNGGTYAPAVFFPFYDGEPGGGIFNFENPANPIAEYTQVLLPYCTGDVHIGNATRTYRAPNALGFEVDLEIQFAGYANTLDVLDWVYANLDDPQRVFVSGSSAGAIGAAFYAGLVAEQYPDARVVALADAGGGFRTEKLRPVIETWDSASILPEWAEYSGLTNETITFQDYFIASTAHNPNLTMAQYNNAYDEVQILFQELMGDDPDEIDLLERLSANYAEIEAGTDRFVAYTAPGEAHTILGDGGVYRLEVDGVRFIDWLDDLLAGQDVRNVSCADTSAGC